MDAQNVRLAAANLYLDQLKETFKSQALRPRLSPIDGIPPPATIGDIHTAISKHLDALITYLRDGAFLKPTEEELIKLNEEMAEYVRNKLEPLTDVKLAECENTDITGPITAKIKEYRQKAASIPISIPPNIAHRVQLYIDVIRSGLELELVNVKAPTVNYTLSRSSASFIQSVADIRAIASPLLHDEFTQQTTPLRAEIAAFVRE